MTRNNRNVCLRMRKVLNATSRKDKILLIFWWQNLDWQEGFGLKKFHNAMGRLMAFSEEKSLFIANPCFEQHKHRFSTWITIQCLYHWSVMTSGIFFCPLLYLTSNETARGKTARALEEGCLQDHQTPRKSTVTLNCCPILILGCLSDNHWN